MVKGWNLHIPFEIYLFLRYFVTYLVNRISKIHPCFSEVVEILVTRNNIVQWPIHLDALTTHCCSMQNNCCSMQNRHHGFVFFQGWGGKHETYKTWVRVKHLRKYHYKLKTHVMLKSFLWSFYGFYHQLVATNMLKSNRITVIIFMKWNLAHYMH